MNKKAQITMFIIVGIAILLIFAFVFSVLPKFKATASGKNAIKDFAESCFVESETCLLYALGSNGGNLEFNENLPELDNITGNEYFAAGAEACQNNFQEFPEQITANGITSELSFNDKDTTIRTKQKIQIATTASTTTFEEYKTSLPVRFRTTHELAKNLKKHQLTLIDKSYINTNLLETDEFNANIYEPNIITLTDKESFLNNINFKFSFIR